MRRRSSGCSPIDYYETGSSKESSEMAKEGYRIFDSDTHVGPYLDVLEKYLTEAEKSKLPAWEQYRSKTNTGYAIYARGQRHYRRKLGAAGPEDTKGKYMAGFTGTH